MINSVMHLLSKDLLFVRCTCQHVCHLCFVVSIWKKGGCKIQFRTDHSLFYCQFTYQIIKDWGKHLWHIMQNAHVNHETNQQSSFAFFSTRWKAFLSV